MICIHRSKLGLLTNWI